MRKLFAWLGTATLLVLTSSAHAQNDVLKPYVVLILDTSGSMASQTGAGPTSCGRSDNRINHAVCAINNIVNSYGDMVFSFGRFREVTNGTYSTSCDSNGDQNGNPNQTLPNPGGGDQCSTQGPYCGDCSPTTGLNKICTANGDCTSNNCANSGAESGAQCMNNLDDDNDGRINDGCAAVGTTENSGNRCNNNLDDDNDGRINDGCPAVGSCGGTFGCTNSDSQFEVLTPLVDGNNTLAAQFTNGVCNTCGTSTSGTNDPEIWGVSPYTFTPLSASMNGAKRYWQGLQATDNTVIWPSNSPGFDPINRDPSNAVFLPKAGNTSCNPNPATCNSAVGCTGTNCCCASQCRPYVTILLTDGDETCTMFSNTTTAAASFLSTVPRNDGVTVMQAVRNNNVVTVTTSAAHPFAVGDSVTVTGMANATFNGSFTVATVTPPSTLTYAQNGANSTSSGGTIFHTASTYQYRIEMKPIGFGVPVGYQPIEDMAHAGGAVDLPGVNEGYYANDESDLELAISQILADSVRSESCNALDDDCDTRVDEDFPNKGGMCTNGQAGNCLRTGTLECRPDGTGLQCNAVTVTPGSEGTVCNQMDDDCDGRIDEGLGCTTCVPVGETCNNKDDDCDGNIDEGLTRACGQGTCTGTEVCTAGTWGGCTAPPSMNEICNGKDDDCDGVCDGLQTGCSEVNGACNPNVATSCPQTDSPGDPGHWTQPDAAEANCTDNVDNDKDGLINDGCPAVNAPETGAACADAMDNDGDGLVNDGCPVPTLPIAQNICHPGTKTCAVLCNPNGNSYGQCSGEVKPAASDPCNGMDDDCDNKIDEDFLPADCSTNCGVGSTSCVNGQITCNSTPAGSDDTCNNVDDDCDGKIDENWICPNPINGMCPCGQGMVCDGLEKCVNGQVVCQGGPVSGETCNCLDDDCDTKTDEGTVCPGGATCTNCQCAFPCAAGEFPCPLGKKCDAGFCVNDPCFQQQCPPVNGHAQTCIPKPNFPNEPQCVDTCSVTTCTSPLICYEPTGECKPDDCTTFPERCTANQVCVNGNCVSNPCEGVQCPSDKYCLGGTCVPSCADVTCPAGQRCRQGMCETDPCGHPCPFGQACNEATGMCIEDPCKFRNCPQGQWCNPGDGQCEDDPCVANNITCPGEGEVCRGGTCVDPDDLRPDAAGAAHVTVGGGGGCSTTGSGTGLLVGLALLATRRRRRVRAAQGGGVQ